MASFNPDSPETAAALSRLQRSLQPLVKVPNAQRFGPLLHCMFGVERQTRTSYYWDGLKRGGDSEHPYIVFQYTLSGRGAFEYYNSPQDSAKTLSVPPGHAFFAVVPAATRYYFPVDAREWSFFWLIIRHPYVVERLVQRITEAGCVWPMDPEGLAVARAVGLMQQIARQGFHDEFEQESDLFDLLMHLERLGRTLTHPDAEKEIVREKVRAYVQAHVNESISVETLGGLFGMSRSNFSHYFATATGDSPANFVAEIKLEQVTRQLLQSDLPLRTIAAQTGFADANHLCKAFRRRYHISPGIFRRHMRRGPV